MIHLKYGVGEEFYRYPEHQQDEQWILEQIKMETSLEAKKKKLQNWSCSTSGTSWKDDFLEKIEDSRKRGRTNMRWINSI